MNTLDLRKKIQPQVQIVERVILQKQPWYLEVLKVFLAIIIVSTIVWGISKADDITLPKAEKPETTSFSVLGTVSSISTSTITLDIQGTNKLNTNTFDVTTLKTIQTSKYLTLSLQDINQGDKVIIQGTDFQGDIKPTRLISFTSSTSTATSTPDVVTASSTATTTPDTSSSTPATTTPSVLDSLTNSVQGAVQDVINTITGSSSTSTPDTSSSTPSTDTSTTTPSILDSLSNTVQGAVQSVVNVIVGSSTPDTSVPVTTDASST